MADFTQAVTIIGFIATFVLVVPNIFVIKPFGDLSYMTEEEYGSYLERISRRAFGNVVFTSGFFLLGLGILRNLALWITWSLYILQNANVDVAGTTFFATLYIVNNILIFTGTIMHHLAETTFWQMAWFGIAFLLRAFEWLLFLAAAILVTVEYANLDPATTSRGEELALLIVLWIIVGLTLIIWLPRAYLFYAVSDEEDELDRPFIPSAAAPGGYEQNAGAQQRAIAAMMKAREHLK